MPAEPMTPPAMESRGGTRHVVVSEDYLDGIVGMSVSKPTGWDAEVVVLSAALVRRYEAAEEELRAAENAIRMALATAPRRKNPKYEPLDEDTDDAKD
jgi:hypothetical protein